MLGYFYQSQFLLALVITCLVEIPLLWFSVHIVLNMKNVPAPWIIFTKFLQMPFPSRISGLYYRHTWDHSIS